MTLRPLLLVVPGSKPSVLGSEAVVTLDDYTDLRDWIAVDDASLFVQESSNHRHLGRVLVTSLRLQRLSR